MLRLSTNSGAYVYSLSFSNAIQVLEPGDFILSFYSLFNCQTAGCDAVGDKLAIKIKTDFYGDYDEVYSTGSDNGRFNDSRWIKEETLIKISVSEIFVSFLS